MTAVAVASGGTWLATAGGDQTVRIWDLAAGGVNAVIRVDSSLHDCAWDRSDQLLAAAGVAGLYLFAFSS